MSRLPDMTGDKPKKKKFKKDPIGYIHIHIDIEEVRTDQGKLRLFVAIDRTSKFVYVELHERAAKMVAARFLHNFTAILPYCIHTTLTDNGVQFTNRKQDTTAFEHIFNRVCRENGTEHRRTPFPGA